MSATTAPRSVSVRPALPADEEALGELDRSTWSTLHAVVPRPRPPYDPFFDERHRPEDFLVAEAATEAGAESSAGSGGTSVAGYIRLVPPTPLACNAHVRQIQGLAVAAWARGAGVGRTLLRAAFAEARRQGAERITLRVLGHNTPARALYASEGFAVEGVLSGEFFLHGRYVDDVLMGRSLAP
ncbi:GNAT family N-acetyltransferase [Streptomyces sp. ISL-112]|uniref:GNAT family N-acetyltransferase n=1 Tax=unclassified Streptomyces TaxID=2593676 RepID=UPI001BE9C15A|nr:MULTISPECIES: GNAT family N-acetyltransferase [unclassified Streptomyces]MBT2429450.1 GNAT family N-acetyltransferase [Streptomyces sp. ISL-112]MBT2463364.1 GNAT family N-acetyltransferase [Streptomyces sp. ISL-63]